MAVEHLEKIARYAELGEAIVALVRQSGVLRVSRRRRAKRTDAPSNPGPTSRRKRGRALSGVPDELYTPTSRTS